MGRRRREYTPLAADVALGNYAASSWAKLSDPEREAWVRDIMAVLRGIPFPYPTLPKDTGREFDRLRTMEMRLREGRVEPWSPIGIRLCNPFFPNRYRATSANRTSAFEAWHDDRKLERAVRFQLDHGDPVLPHRVLRAVTMQYRTPSVFKPSTARHVYETLCHPGGRAWDPCAGYGGRVLGALAAGVRYVGTDVEPETVEGNRRLAEAVGLSDLAEMSVHPAESFDPGPVDLVFTSPPYFDRERYSGRRDQSWVRHGGGFDAWVAGFLDPVIGTAFGRLPSGGRLALNVADVRERGSVIPVVSRSMEAATRVGFVHEATWWMPLARLNRKRPEEPILVFRKP